MTKININDLNTLDKKEALQSFMMCCGSTIWSSMMEAARPFQTEEDVFNSARDIWYNSCAQKDYKEAFSHELSVAMIRDGAGSQFDPDLVDVFLKIQSEFHDFERRSRHLAESNEKAGRELKPLTRATNDPLSIPLPEASQALEQMPTPEIYH